MIECVLLTLLLLLANTVKIKSCSKAEKSSISQNISLLLLYFHLLFGYVYMCRMSICDWFELGRTGHVLSVLLNIPPIECELLLYRVVKGKHDPLLQVWVNTL